MREADGERTYLLLFCADIANIKDMVGDKRFAGMCSDSIESCAESHMRST